MQEPLLTAQLKELKELYRIVNMIESPKASSDKPYFEFNEEFKKVLPAFGFGVQMGAIALPGVTRAEIAKDTSLSGTLSERLDQLYNQGELPTVSDLPDTFAISGFEADGNAIEKAVLMVERREEGVWAEIDGAFDLYAKYKPGRSKFSSVVTTPLAANHETGAIEFSEAHIKSGLPPGYELSCTKKYSSRKATLSNGKSVWVVKRYDVGRLCPVEGTKPTAVFLIH